MKEPALSKYPKIRIESKLANNSFVKVVAKTLDQIDLANPSLLPKETRKFLEILKNQGRPWALANLIGGSRLKNVGQFLTLLAKPSNDLGEVIVKHVLQSDPESFPTNDIQVGFIGNEIVVGLSSMLIRQTDSGDIYHSRKRLKVKIEDKDYIVAFSKHAINAVCNRFKPSYQTYLGLGDAHALFSSLNYCELCTLVDGNSSISIFDLCLAPGCWEYDNYVERCAPNLATKAANSVWSKDYIPYGYRVGYFPIVLADGYAIAKTFLPPGFSKTPERKLIYDKANTDQRSRLIEIAESLDYQTLRRGNALEAIKWFHANGIPQVIDPPVQLFDTEYLKMKIGAE